jgi:hypothetical protein
MTRSTLKRTLRRIYLLLLVVLGISFLAKIADHVPLLAGTGAELLLKDAYEFLRDMSLLIATGGVARHHRRQIGALHLRAAGAPNRRAVPGDVLQVVGDHRQHALGLPERG